ncbi:hypothetical protein CDAR_392061 [Caerostris darwini]|uniref:Uncharacterized protein n=1 Tax=Caerostris darwini TaxID=1538125 RepID=A0AAV4S2R7_9ARAC|nr:hypothetical protein CDAR_392061 [Caerostris darwini]
MGEHHALSPNWLVILLESAVKPSDCLGQSVVLYFQSAGCPIIIVPFTIPGMSVCFQKYSKTEISEYSISNLRYICCYALGHLTGSLEDMK